MRLSGPMKRFKVQINHINNKINGLCADYCEFVEPYDADRRP